MKLVHISDIHINPEPILGADPVASFAECLAHVAEHQSDADRIVITGDLTHHGLKQSYERLAAMLADSPLKGDLAPRLLVGNHDNRENFFATFLDAVSDDNGHVQWTEETPAGLFVYIDTIEPGTHAGHYCEKRQEWLRGTLANARTKGHAVWLFMHHNPLPVRVLSSDEIGLVQEQAFQTILGEYRDIIRHIFFGHCHYILSGSVAGIPFSAPRSTNHPCVPVFNGNTDLGFGPLNPTYNVCFLGDDGVVVHTIDYTVEAEITWLKTTDNGWIEEKVPAE